MWTLALFRSFVVFCLALFVIAVVVSFFPVILSFCLFICLFVLGFLCCVVLGGGVVVVVVCLTFFLSFFCLDVVVM